MYLGATSSAAILVVVGDIIQITFTISAYDSHGASQAMQGSGTAFTVHFDPAN